jgi:hypothetical protein
MDEPKLVCWKCGASLKGVPIPLSRRAECLACHAELHVCRLCHFYDPRVEGKCREDRAEEVREKERANFCDYFKPRPNAFRAKDTARTEAAKGRIDALFAGGEVNDAPNVPSELEALFGNKREKPKE